jgi:hypothetical protein
MMKGVSSKPYGESYLGIVSLVGYPTTVLTFCIHHVPWSSVFSVPEDMSARFPQVVGGGQIL